MNCEEFRRAVGAEPSMTQLEALEHAASCVECARYRGEMRAMRSVIHTLAQISPFTNSSSLSFATGCPFIVTSMRPVSCKLTGSSLRIWCVPSLM